MSARDAASRSLVLQVVLAKRPERVTLAVSRLAAAMALMHFAYTVSAGNSVMVLISPPYIRYGTL
jgi:hypothetical protein